VRKSERVPVLLSGGNPQIAKADGDAPVQEYIARCRAGSAPLGSGSTPRWIDVHEDDLEEAQMAMRIKQAAALPGWVPGQP
jgi:hypothetical protein